MDGQTFLPGLLGHLPGDDLKKPLSTYGHSYWNTLNIL